MLCDNVLCFKIFVYIIMKGKKNLQTFVHFLADPNCLNIHLQSEKRGFQYEFLH